MGSSRREYAQRASIPAWQKVGGSSDSSRSLTHQLAREFPPPVAPLQSRPVTSGPPRIQRTQQSLMERVTVRYTIACSGRSTCTGAGGGGSHPGCHTYLHHDELGDASDDDLTDAAPRRDRRLVNRHHRCRCYANCAQRLKIHRVVRLRRDSTRGGEAALRKKHGQEKRSRDLPSRQTPHPIRTAHARDHSHHKERQKHNRLPVSTLPTTAAERMVTTAEAPTLCSRAAASNTLCSDPTTTSGHASVTFTCTAIGHRHTRVTTHQWSLPRQGAEVWGNDVALNQPDGHAHL